MSNLEIKTIMEFDKMSREYPLVVKTIKQMQKDIKQLKIKVSDLQNSVSGSI